MKNCLIFLNIVLTFVLVFPNELLAATVQSKDAPTLYQRVDTIVTGEENILLQGVKVHPHDPLQLTFILDDNGTHMTSADIEKNLSKHIKYFLAALAIPEDKKWVNLNPHESHRVIPQSLGRTDLGLDMLRQDLVLKDFTSELLSPQNPVGKNFWNHIYKQLESQYDITNLPIDIMTKVWIVPGPSRIRVTGQRAIITEAELNVLMEDDYFALRQHRTETHRLSSSKSINTTIKNLLIPLISEEVNSGQRFRDLRQIHHAMILAAWYKTQLKNSFLNQHYTDQERTTHIHPEGTDSNIQQIFANYVEGFQDGRYSIVREDYHQAQQQIIQRQYVVGGIHMTVMAENETDSIDQLLNQLIDQITTVEDSITEIPLQEIFGQFFMAFINPFASKLKVDEAIEKIFPAISKKIIALRNKLIDNDKTENSSLSSHQIDRLLEALIDRMSQENTIPRQAYYILWQTLGIPTDRLDTLINNPIKISKIRAINKAGFKGIETINKLAAQQNLLNPNLQLKFPSLLTRYSIKEIFNATAVSALNDIQRMIHVYTNTNNPTFGQDEIIRHSDELIKTLALNSLYETIPDSDSEDRFSIAIAKSISSIIGVEYSKIQDQMQDENIKQQAWLDLKERISIFINSLDNIVSDANISKLITQYPEQADINDIDELVADMINPFSEGRLQDPLKFSNYSYSRLPKYFPKSLSKQLLWILAARQRFNLTEMEVLYSDTTSDQLITLFTNAILRLPDGFDHPRVRILQLLSSAIGILWTSITDQADTIRNDTQKLNALIVEQNNLINRNISNLVQNIQDNKFIETNEIPTSQHINISSNVTLETSTEVLRTIFEEPTVTAILTIRGSLNFKDNFDEFTSLPSGLTQKAKSDLIDAITQHLQNLATDEIDTDKTVTIAQAIGIDKETILTALTDFKSKANQKQSTTTVTTKDLENPSQSDHSLPENKEAANAKNAEQFILEAIDDYLLSYDSNKNNSHQLIIKNTLNEYISLSQKFASHSIGEIREQQIKYIRKLTLDKQLLLELALKYIHADASLYSQFRSNDNLDFLDRVIHNDVRYEELLTERDNNWLWKESMAKNFKEQLEKVLGKDVNIYIENRNTVIEIFNQSRSIKIPIIAAFLSEPAFAQMKDYIVHNLNLKFPKYPYLEGSWTAEEQQTLASLRTAFYFRYKQYESQFSLDQHIFFLEQFLGTALPDESMLYHAIKYIPEQSPQFVQTAILHHPNLRSWLLEKRSKNFDKNLDWSNKLISSINKNIDRVFDMDKDWIFKSRSGDKIYPLIRHNLHQGLLGLITPNPKIYQKSLFQITDDEIYLILDKKEFPRSLSSNKFNDEISSNARLRKFIQNPEQRDLLDAWIEITSVKQIPKFINRYDNILAQQIDETDNLHWRLISLFIFDHYRFLINRLETHQNQNINKKLTINYYESLQELIEDTKFTEKFTKDLEPFIYMVPAFQELITPISLVKNIKGNVLGFNNRRLGLTIASQSSDHLEKQGLSAHEYGHLFTAENKEIIRIYTFGYEQFLREHPEIYLPSNGAIQTPPNEIFQTLSNQVTYYGTLNEVYNNNLPIEERFAEEIRILVKSLATTGDLPQSSSDLYRFIAAITGVGYSKNNAFIDEHTLRKSVGGIDFYMNQSNWQTDNTPIEYPTTAVLEPNIPIDQMTITIEAITNPTPQVFEARWMLSP